jgi:type II secretory pathway predicted ATPase ExeA
MYETHFGLRERPFRPAPDSASYYPATSHEQTLARLQQALADGEGLVLLTGDPGTGKTLLCHLLLERLGPGIASAFVTNCRVGAAAGLLQAILYDLSLPYQGLSEQELRLALTDALLQGYAAGRRTVLVIDEAQHLGPDLLEELRLLANLEARRARAVQVMLSAQPALMDTLRRDGSQAVAQRLAVRTRLAPLGEDEAADFLIHQVRTAGGRPEKVWTDEALAILARGSRGVPRLLNQAAHLALTLACQAGASLVDAEAALEALAGLGLEYDEPAGEPQGSEADGEERAEAAEAAEAEDAGVLTLGEAVVEEAAPVAGEEGGEDDEACHLFPVPRRPA